MRYLIILFVLYGCATPEEKAAREYEEQKTLNREYTAAVDGQCNSYGLTKGTEEFRKCVMAIDMANRQQSEAQRQMLIQEYLRQRGVFRR